MQRAPQCLNTLCYRCHCNLLLHEVHEQMEDNTRQDRAVADEIHLGDDESHGNGADKEIDYIQRVHHEADLISPFNKDQRGMLERP